MRVMIFLMIDWAGLKNHGDGTSSSCRGYLKFIASPDGTTYQISVIMNYFSVIRVRSNRANRVISNCFPYSLQNDFVNFCSYTLGHLNEGYTPWLIVGTSSTRFKLNNLALFGALV